MKAHKISLVAALALGGLLACTTLASAQDNGTNAPRRGGRGMSVEARMERLDTELKLTDEQKPKVKTALEASMKKMQELRSDQNLSQEDRREKMGAIREEENKQLKTILTKEQFEKYQAMPRPGRGGQKGEAKKAN